MTFFFAQIALTLDRHGLSPDPAVGDLVCLGDGVGHETLLGGRAAVEQLQLALLAWITARY